MNFYQSLGYLIFGSRLKRLSEYFLSEINQAYVNEGIDFDAHWFPVFYLLSEHQPVSILELSEAMIVSHSAASQLVTGLKKRGLVNASRHKDDGRKQEIVLTEKGEELLKQLLPIWDAINKAMSEIIEGKSENKALLQILTTVETSLQQSSLAKKISENIEKA